MSDTVDCSHVRKHSEHHHPHPVTGRLVCEVCHPVMPKIVKRKSASYGPGFDGRNMPGSKDWLPRLGGDSV